MNGFPRIGLPAGLTGVSLHGHSPGMHVDSVAPDHGQSNALPGRSKDPFIVLVLLMYPCICRSSLVVGRFQTSGH